MREEWKTCLEFPNYEVSNTGKIRRVLNGRQLIIGTDTRGYSVVRLWYNKKKYTKRIARLVWTTFNDCGCHNTIDHIDRDKNNNTIENLRCITHKENSLNRNIYGKNVYNLNDDKKKLIIMQLRNKQKTVKQIWEEFGIPTNYLNIVLQRGSWDKLLNDHTRV
jgi:hypothetical protein